MTREASNIKTVYIFDADGVVIEPWGFANALESDHNITRAMTDEFFSREFHACLVGEADLRTKLTPYLPNWTWQGSIDELIRLWHESEDLPRPSILLLVHELRSSGHICCLASNQEAERADYIRHHMGFSQIFDHLFFSCDLGATKPDRKFYESITSTLNCSPENITFWDDTEQHVIGACNAGWNAYLYESEESLHLPSN